MNEPVQPEQTYFPDPSIDRIMGIVFNLAAEVQVLRDRVRVLEHVLEGKSVLARSEIDEFRGSDEQEQAIAADSRDFVRHLLEPVLARAASRNDMEADREL
jgi:hypothetical protein